MVYLDKYLLGYKGNPPTGELKIKDGTICIAGSALLYGAQITSVEIPQSVIHIGAAAFSGCKNLTSINQPESLTEITENCFYECQSLKSITIPKNVIRIGFRAFFKSGITDIVIPGNVKAIGEGAFTLNGIENIVISHGVTSIDRTAFEQTYLYRSDIVIPSTVTYTGYRPFFYSSINSLYIASNNICADFLGYASIANDSINMLTETPPTISSTTLTNSYIKGINVPQGCADAYKAADVWSGYNIQEFSDEQQAFYISYKQLQTAVEALDNNNLTNNDRFLVYGEDFNYYISCNESDYMEGNIRNLFDGNPSTFFHSNWHGTIKDVHYLQIDLDGKKSDNIAFSYLTRKGYGDWPQSFELQASVDGVNFTTVKQFDGLPWPPSGTKWSSGEIALGQEYSHFRINVKSPRTYFHMAEFEFNLNNYSDATDNRSIYDTDEFNSLKEYIAEAKQMLGTVTFSEEESARMIKKINDTYEAALNAIAVEPRTFDLTVTQAGYATLFLDYPVGIPEGVGAYTADHIDGIYLKMNQLASVIPANTGVIIKAEPGTYTFTENNASQSVIGRNMLSGTVEDRYITPEANAVCYVLSVVNGVAGMYRVELNADGAFKNNANKAYMAVQRLGVGDGNADTSDPTTQLSTVFRFDFSGTTAIENTATDNNATPVYYDLRGRRVQNPINGIYIVNGKKVLVK